MITPERARQYWEDKRNEITLNVRSTKVTGLAILKECKSCGSWNRDIKCRYCGSEICFTNGK